MSSLAENLQASYFPAFDGTKNWEGVEDKLENLYHPDLVVVNAQGEQDRATMKECVKNFIMAGGMAKDIAATPVAEDKVCYRVTLVHGNGTVTPIESVGTFKDKDYRKYITARTNMAAVEHLQKLFPL